MDMRCVSDKSRRIKLQECGYDVVEHKLSIPGLMATLDTKIDKADPTASQGLSLTEAKLRLKRDGPNVITPSKRTPELFVYLKLYLDALMVMLLLASVLSFILYWMFPKVRVNLWCGVVLSCIVFLQCTLTYFLQRQSSDVLAALKAMVPALSHVRREGQLRRMPAAELVVGDVVILKAGDRVPADLRILQSSGLMIESSSLTGESAPAEAVVHCTHEEPHESRNMAMSTCLCTQGSGVGVVLRTGNGTFIGTVALLACETRGTVTTLQKEVRRVVYIIALISALEAVLILFAGFVQGLGSVVVLNLVITMFSANVPQGLPSTVAMCLGMAAKRLSQRNVLVKHLEVVETLGAATCIASDKTGTLTQNRMSVQGIWFNSSFEMMQGTGGISTTDGATNSSSRGFSAWRQSPLEPLLVIAALCNTATVTVEEGQTKEQVEDLEEGADAAKTEVSGDATEVALFHFCDRLFPVEQLRAMYPKVHEQPFNSSSKFALCVTELPGAPDKHYVLMKGAPEVVESRCDRWLCGGEVRPIDEEFQNQFVAAYERFAGAGERVLGFASQLVEKRPDADLVAESAHSTGLVFMGLISLADPPKLGVDKAVLECHAAGIKVFMVTGDHALTAEAIAKRVNIITRATRRDVAAHRGLPVEAVQEDDPDIVAAVVSGSDLKLYTEEQWDLLLAHPELVFARTTPAQKLEIVQRLQALGHVVAVTGDGVNDAPALKRADIGVAMGSPNASDVAREAADLIIMDDDFCSIVNGIREGRLLFDNLRKSITYTLTHLGPEIVPVVLNILFLVPLGISPLLILTIDLGSELMPALALALEQPESAIMKRPPRKLKKDFLVTWQVLVYAYLIAGLVQSGIAAFSYFFVFSYFKIPFEDLVRSCDNYWSPGAANFVTSTGLVLTDAQQVYVMSVLNGAIHAVLVLTQLFHLWFMRTRTTSVFRHSLFSNPLCWLSMLWQLGFVVLFGYLPQLAPVFVSGMGLPLRFWLPSLAFLSFIFVYSEVSKYYKRKQHATGQRNCMARLAW